MHDYVVRYRAEVTSEPEIRPLTRDSANAYVAFARGAFGPQSYQAQRSYLRWLYEDAPEPNGWHNANIAVVDDRVVGCFHSMVLPWAFGSDVRHVRTPHNLFVDAVYRTGLGLALITETLRGSDDALLFGAGPAVRPIYERLRAELIPTFSFATIVNPLSAPFVALAAQVARHRFDSFLERASIVLGRGALRVHRSPTSALLARVATLLEYGAGARPHVRWTVQLLRWRFFAPFGPRHFLATDRDDVGAAAIVSIGIHRSLLLARIVEWRAVDDRSARKLLVKLRAFLTAIGVNLLVAVTSDGDIAQQWHGAGFWQKKTAPAVFYLRRRKQQVVSKRPLSFCGGAADAGFEALALDSVS